MNEMEKNEKLEIRGINRDELVTYLTELGGKIITNDKNLTVINSGEWNCVVAPEEFFTFMHSEIPKIQLEFHSENKEILTKVLREFRLKTFRAGG